MEKIVPLFNQLQEILHKTNLHNALELPQIVAVGAQSTGKSSVLESILGKDILPRGSGIVTRRPIILQLNHLPTDEYIEFSHQKGVRYKDWHQARLELEEEMKRGAGENKGISSIAIVVRMYSPSIVNLNIVDLPGITKIPVGDQPPDIENQVYKMIMNYIKNPNTIILAVTPANIDIANSDSLKLAREVDPEGNRTIGVLTKLDLIDQEDTHILEALEGKLYKLKLGYIGVVNRSQKDLENSKSVQRALADEKNFFQNHKIYRKFSEKMGIEYLIKELNTAFLRSIKMSLPSIGENIRRFIQEIETEMIKGGDSEIDPDNKEARGQIILNSISKFVKTYCEMISGNYSNDSTKELLGGARIYHIIFHLFQQSVDDINAFSHLSDETIRVAIRNANGLSGSLCISESAFENITKQQILRLEKPSLECALFVHEELRKLLQTIEIAGFSRFRVLAWEIARVVERHLARHYSATKEMIRNLISIELEYINTNHPQFVGGVNLLLNLSQSKEVLPEDHNWNLDQLGKFILQKVKPELFVKKIEEQIKEIFLEGMGDNNEQDVFVDHSKSQGQTPELKDQAKKNEVDGLEESIKNLEKINLKEYNKSDMLERQAFHKVMKTPLKIHVPKLVQGSKFSQYVVDEFKTVKLPPILGQMKVVGELNDQEKAEIFLIKELVLSYFNVVKKNINDSVTKTIITFLINRIKNECEKELVTVLYREELYEHLLKEDEFTMEERKLRRERFKFLKQCSRIITEMECKL